MLENEHTNQFYACLQSFSTLGFHYKPFFEELWLYSLFQRGSPPFCWISKLSCLLIVHTIYTIATFLVYVVHALYKARVLFSTWHFNPGLEASEEHSLLVFHVSWKIADIFGEFACLTVLLLKKPNRLCLSYQKCVLCVLLV